MSESDDFEEIDCDHVLAGRVARVLIAKRITREFLELESNKQARLIANAKLWADGYQPSDQQFNGNEGRCGGDNNRMLVAVKAFKIRLYGFVRHYRGRKTLLIVEMDDSKKQNKANTRVLKRAKLAAVAMDIRCGD